MKRRSAAAGDLLERPRLMAAMDLRYTRRLTLVIAGPGFGKSCLLAQAVARNALAPRGIDVRLECQAGHADAARLAVDLALAAGVPAPVEGEAAHSLADAIGRRAPVDVALVLDDAHRIPPGSSGARLLAGLLAALPGNGHLVVASRVAPPLAVARLEARGAVTRIAEPDLLLSSRELAALAVLRSVPLDVVGPSAGWPALADLATRRHRREGSSPPFDDYLREEVLESLGPDRRRELAVLSGLFDLDLDPELASAAAGHDVDLEGLLADLPLVAREGGRFRLHPLWRRPLSRGADREARGAARLRAAGLLIRRGAIDEAMTLAAEEGSWSTMRAAIREACAPGPAPWGRRHSGGGSTGSRRRPWTSPRRACWARWRAWSGRPARPTSAAWSVTRSSSTSSFAAAWTRPGRSPARAGRRSPPRSATGPASWRRWSWCARAACPRARRPPCSGPRP